MPKLLLRASPLTLALLVACSESEGTDAGTNPPPPPADAGVADMGAPDTGVVMNMDASVPDSGVCDPLTPTAGCESPKVCTFNPNSNRPECRTIPGVPVPHEGACNAGTQNCEAGLSCIQLMGDATPVCRYPCDDGMAGACQGVTGSSATYSCQGLENMMGPLLYGMCLGRGNPCDPVMDTCPANQVCALRARNTFCEPAGLTPRGGDCTMNECMKGSICIPLQGTAGPICYEPCNPQMPMCTSGQCAGLQGFSFGICR